MMTRTPGNDQKREGETIFKYCLVITPAPAHAGVD
jgi:hypothetical protein